MGVRLGGKGKGERAYFLVYQRSLIHVFYKKKMAVKERQLTVARMNFKRDKFSCFKQVYFIGKIEYINLFSLNRIPKDKGG